MSKGFVIIIVKILIALIIFASIVTLIIQQINRSMTTSEAANNALQKELFTQDCLELGVSDYFCATPSEDNNPNDPKWNGCPAGETDGYKYITKYTCEPTIKDGVEQAAYCCTRITPKTCELPGLRTCVNKVADDKQCDNGYHYVDGCDKDCSETENGYSKCVEYNPNTKLPGIYCSEYPACCGKTNDRRCAFDCPPEYPTLIERPPDPEGSGWGCQENEWTACCQK